MAAPVMDLSTLAVISVTACELVFLTMLECMQQTKCLKMPQYIKLAMFGLHLQMA